MYRAYQPLRPATNKYLQEKWDRASYQKHRRKVELAVPVLNTTGPSAPFHLQVNLKKTEKEKERQAIRDRDNFLHYAKLWDIKHSQGSLDNWNLYRTHSLNWEKRRWDIARIDWENQQLLKRLERRKSELAQEHWQQNWHKEQLLRQSIARYPRDKGSYWAKKERPRICTEGSGIFTSASASSPSRTHRLCQQNSRMAKSLWGTASESISEGELMASALPALRKRHGLKPSGALVLQPSERALRSAKIAPRASSKAAHGSLVRTNLSEGEYICESSLSSR